MTSQVNVMLPPPLHFHSHLYILEKSSRRTFSGHIYAAINFSMRICSYVRRIKYADVEMLELINQYESTTLECYNHHLFSLRRKRERIIDASKNYIDFTVVRTRWTQTMTLQEVQRNTAWFSTLLLVRTPSISFQMSLEHKILVYFSTIIWSEMTSKKVWRQYHLIL